jgi:predicted metal-dependent hydrolase
MIPRNPKLTFEDALPHWAPNRAFAHIVNASSMCLVPLETYLNKVMARVAKQTNDAQLKRDIALFSAQEGNHYRQHRVYNRVLHEHYPGLKAMEDQLQADYDRFLAERSLKFNAAYCEGFESVGIGFTQFFFEEAGDLLEGADPRVVRLWRWHLAEEFEHRTVCFDALRAVGGNYLDRMHGFYVVAKHLRGWSAGVSAYMLSVDREKMSPAEREASIAQEQQYRARLKAFNLPHALAIITPGYNPRRKRMPNGVADYLQTVPEGMMPAA